MHTCASRTRISASPPFCPLRHARCMMVDAHDVLYRDLTHTALHARRGLHLDCCVSRGRVPCAVCATSRSSPSARVSEEDSVLRCTPGARLHPFQHGRAWRRGIVPAPSDPVQVWPAFGVQGFAPTSVIAGLLGRAYRCFEVQTYHRLYKCAAIVASTQYGVACTASDLIAALLPACMLPDLPIGKCFHRRAIAAVKAFEVLHTSASFQWHVTAALAAPSRSAFDTGAAAFQIPTTCIRRLRCIR